MAAVLAVWALAAVVQLGLAYLDVRAGIRATLAAQDDLTPAAILHGRIDERLEQARARFGSGERRAAGLLVSPLQLAPVAGRQIRSFAALAGAAEQVTGVAASAAAASEPHMAGAGEPARRVAALHELGRVVAAARLRLAHVELGPERNLIGQLADRRADLARRLDQGRATLERTGRVVATVERLLSGDQRYLFLAANNAEMRAGSGMFLEAGVLEARGGKLTLGPLRPTAELSLPGEGVPVEGDLAARWGWLRPGREWRNLALSPRFDVTGPLAARMWTSLTGQHVDGVMAVDVEALRAVLAATGPVDTAGRAVSEHDVSDRLLHDQYVDFGDDHAARRDELGQIAAAAMASLEAGRFDLGRLAAELAHAARGRHLLAWSADGRDQAGWAAAGLAGRLGSSSLAVGVLNRGGNKLDRFLETANRLELRPVPGGQQATLAVRVRNATPTGEPPYVAGPNPGSGVGEGTYLGIVSVQLPGAALDVGVDGDPPLVASGPDGPTTVIATPVVVGRGEERVVVFRFHLPGRTARLRVEPSARLPAARWDHAGSSWRDEHARWVSASGPIRPGQ